MNTWSYMKAQDAAAMLGTDTERGLDDREAARRRKKSAASPVSRSGRAYALTALSFGHAGLFMPFLMAVCAVTLFINGRETAGLSITAALILNIAGIFSAYARALSVADRHAQESYPCASVIRGGVLRKIQADKLVVGDVVILERGDFIPFDMKLLVSENLTVLESPEEKTGSSHSVFERYGVGRPGKSDHNEKKRGSRLVRKDSSDDASSASTVLRAGSAVISGRARAVVCELSYGYSLISVRKRAAVRRVASVPEVRRARKVSSLFSLILAAYVLLFFALSLLPGSGSSAGAFILLCACAGASGAEFIAAFAVISYGALLHRILRSPYCGSVLLSNADPSGLCSARRFILPLSSVLSDDSFMLSYVAGENNTKYFLTPVSEGKCPPCIGLRDGENAVGTDKVQTVFFSEDASASRYEGNHTATAGVMPADVAAVLQNALLACGRTDSVGQTVAPISAEGFGDADDRIAGQIEEYWKKAGTKGTSFRDFKGITGYASSGGARICSVYTPAGSYAVAFGRLNEVLPLCSYTRIGTPGLSKGKLEKSIFAASGVNKRPARIYAVALSRAGSGYEPDENGRVSTQRLLQGVLSSAAAHPLSFRSAEAQNGVMTFSDEDAGNPGDGMSLALFGLIVCEGNFAAGTKEIMSAESGEIQLILRARDREQYKNATLFFENDPVSSEDSGRPSGRGGRFSLRDGILTSSDVRRMSDEELRKAIPHVRVIYGLDRYAECRVISAARMTPDKKSCGVCWGGSDISDIVCMKSADTPVFMAEQPESSSGRRDVRTPGMYRSASAARLACDVIVPPVSSRRANFPADAARAEDKRRKGVHSSNDENSDFTKEKSGQSKERKKTTLPYDISACDGGLNSLLSARKRLLMLGNAVGRTTCYLLASTALKAVAVIPSAFGAASVSGVVFVALMGLLLDFAVAAVLSAAPIAVTVKKPGGIRRHGRESAAEKADDECDVKKDAPVNDGTSEGASYAGAGYETAPDVSASGKKYSFEAQDKGASCEESGNDHAVNEKGAGKGAGKCTRKHKNTYKADYSTLRLLIFAAAGIVAGGAVCALSTVLVLCGLERIAPACAQACIALISLSFAIYLYFLPVVSRTENKQ